MKLIRATIVASVAGQWNCLEASRNLGGMKTSPGSEQENRPFQFTGRIRSFRHAFVGVWRMIRCQHNAWIHAVATAIVICAGFFFPLSGGEWCRLVLALATVWTAEALNTAFEFLADVASPEFHPLVRDAKDVAAGAVLITAIAAAVIGAITFWPHVADQYALCRCSRDPL